MKSIRKRFVAIILLAVMVFSDFQMSTSLAMDNSSAVEETEVAETDQYSKSRKQIELYFSRKSLFGITEHTKRCCVLGRWNRTDKQYADYCAKRRWFNRRMDMQ